jgi:hypothetical protein
MSMADILVSNSIEVAHLYPQVVLILTTPHHASALLDARASMPSQ